MTERERFEKWVSSPPYEYACDRWPDDPVQYGWPGSYVNIATQLAWEAWQAAQQREESDERT